MDLLVFLYPTKSHWSWLFNDFRLMAWQSANRDPNRLSQIIDQRYRQNGYQVIWASFSLSHETSQIPDPRILAPELGIQNGDKVIAVGITEADMFKRKLYPDQSFIVEQLRPPSARVVVGGFLNGDCVERLAAELHRVGRRVMVDEDITDLFVGRNRRDRPIPIDWSPWAGVDRPDEYRDLPGEHLDLGRAHRSDKPWRVQWPALSA
ncbi:MAG: hypothetical protein V1826_01885 [bacterium]